MRLGGVSTGFVLGQLIIDLGDDAAQWQQKLPSVLVAYDAVLLDDFSILDPPPGIPGETRPVPPHPTGSSISPHHARLWTT